MNVEYRDKNQQKALITMNVCISNNVALRCPKENGKQSK